MGKLTKSPNKQDGASATPIMESDSSDTDVATLVPGGDIKEASTYHIWNSPQASLKITTPDMTPLYTVHRYASLSTESTIRITSPNSEDDLFATISSHSGISKNNSYIEIHMDAIHSPPSGYTFSPTRDGGSLTRKHKMTLSDGKTYVLTGKHSSSILMCWGNLKVVEQGSKTIIAEFKAEWPMSLHKMGTVTFKKEVEKGLAREILFAFVGAANKEYVLAMASMMVAVPAATC